MKNYLTTVLTKRHRTIRYFIVLCLFVSNSNMNAQNKEQLFGVRLSGGLANFLYKDLPSRYHPRGVSYDIALSTYLNWYDTSLGFNVEMGYAQKNVKDDFKGYSLNYLSLGLMPNYCFKGSSLILFLGVNGAILNYYTVLNNNPKGSTNFFKPYDVNFIVGFDKTLFIFDRVIVDLDSRFNLGLLNIQNSYSGSKTRNYGFSIGLLIKQDLKKRK